MSQIARLCRNLVRGNPLRECFWSLVRPDLQRLLGGVFFLAVGSVATLLYPQAIRGVVDAAVGQGTPPALERTVIYMLALSLLVGISAYARCVLFDLAGERVVTRLRERFYQVVLNQDIAYFDTTRTGELVSRLGSDCAVIQNTVSSNVSGGIRSAAQAIGGIVFLFYTSPRLSVVMLLLICPVALSGDRFGRRVRHLARRAQNALASASGVAAETISGIRTVRSFNAEQAEISRYTAAVRTAYGLARERILANGLFRGAAALSTYAAGALLFWYGGRLVARGEMTMGALVSFLLYSVFVAIGLGGVGDVWGDLMRATGAVTSVFELLMRQPAIRPCGGFSPNTADGKVELRGVHFAYQTRADARILDGIDLVIEPGEVVGVMGLSGAGKSTLVAMFARWYDPQDGLVLFDGHDIRGLDPVWLRRQIGIVGQEPVLFSTTIAENIRYGRPDASNADVEAAALAANARGFISDLPLGYETPIGERGLALSGGQRQRIAIARTVLRDPKFLILDEATSALDAESEHLVKEAIQRLMHQRTTMIIAHRLSSVMTAHRLVVLHEGRIAETGTQASLLAQDGLFRRMVERQLQTNGPATVSATSRGH